MSDFRLLLLGGAGQLGWEILRATDPAGIAITSLERDRVDLTEPGSATTAIEGVRPDLIVNAMGYTAVDRAESEPDQAFRINRDGPAEIAAAAAELGAALIHISTDYVFDGASERPYREDDPVTPIGVYARSKAEGEAAVRDRLDRHLILRTAWLHSAHGQNFVKTMLRLADEGRPVRVVADQIGCPTWGADLAAAILTLADRVREDGDNLPWGTYHLTGAGETSWHGFAEAIFARLGEERGRRPQLSAIATADYTTAARRPAYAVLDCGLIRRRFGIAQRPWRQGLDRMLDELFAAELATP